MILTLYDKDHNKIKPLYDIKDYHIDSVLSTGDKTLSFIMPGSQLRDISNESYVRDKDEFVIKSITPASEGWYQIQCNLNVEALESYIEKFETVEKTMKECLDYAFVGTGWRVGVCEITKRRTLRRTNTTPWQILQDARKTYRAEIAINSIDKVIDIYSHIGVDKGVYFTEQLNLKDLKKQSTSFNFYTQILPKGKDNLTIESVNDGKDTLSDFSYSTKVKTFLWIDQRYTVAESLKEDAQYKLNEMSKPVVAYTVSVIDLAKMSDVYKDVLAFRLGDTVTLLHKSSDTYLKTRIVKTTVYPNEPNRNTCDVANSILTLEDIQQDLQDAADTVSNVTTNNGELDGSKVDNITTNQISDFSAKVGEITDFTAIKASITDLYATRATIQDLQVVNARIGTLEATSITTVVFDAEIAKINQAIIGKADITDLNAASGKINVLESQVSTITTLIGGSATVGDIHTLVLNAENTTIANALIKSAMIDSVTANKITAGIIDASSIHFKSKSGNMDLFDNTLLIKDAARPRVQIGKDAAGDYNIYVWDKTGKLMFDATGVTADGIQRPIIRNDMVSPNANIDGSKINIVSLVTEINNGVSKIQASHVLYDGKSLDVAFNEMQTTLANPNMVANGNGEQRDNTNFSNFVYDGEDHPLGTYGSFITSKSMQVDKTIPFNPDKDYTISFWHKVVGTDTDGKHWYFSLRAFDADGLEIQYRHVNWYGNTLTKLAKPLKNGDTVIYFENLDNWSKTTLVSYQKGFIAWNYRDKKGYTYPPQTYSRNVYKDIYVNGDSVDKTARTITLKAPWSNGDIPAGTSICQCTEGATYPYIGVIANAQPTWTKFDGIFGKSYTLSNVLRYANTILPFLVNFGSTKPLKIAGLYIAPYAPTNDVIKNMTTQINVQQGKIATLITDTSQTKQDLLNTKGTVTTLQSNYSSLQQTVTGLSTTVGQHTSSISNVDKEVKAVSDKQTTFEATLNGISGKVSNIENTTTSHSDIINGLTTTVNETKSALANLKLDYNGFKVNVSNTYTNKTEFTVSDELNRSLALMATGKLLYQDPTFVKGLNDVRLYDNSGKGNMTITRIARPADCPTSSNYCVQITVKGPASPELGGFYHPLYSRANAKFIVKYLIKLPVGYRLYTNSNSMGVGYIDKFIGPTEGTGQWAEYIRSSTCGSTGVFSTGGHVRVSGPTPTADKPLEWYLGAIYSYDVTDADDVYVKFDNYSTTTQMNSAITQKANEINLSVSQNYASKSSLNDIDARMSTAEQKITAGAIVSTVTSSYEWIGLPDSVQQSMMGTAKSLPNNIDLDTYITPGIWTTSGLMGAIHTPPEFQSNSEVRLVVEYIGNSLYVQQTLIATYSGNPKGMWKRSKGYSSWYSWEKIANTGNIVSCINQTAETIKIQASKIQLEGTVTANNYFKINLNGSMEATSGKIGGWDINYSSISSSYVELNHSGVSLYDGILSSSNLRSTMDENGMHYYRDGYYLGKIGTNKLNSDNSKKGIVFDLEDRAAYMTWACADYPGGEYMTKFTYCNNAMPGFSRSDCLYLGTQMHTNNFPIHLSDDIHSVSYNDGGGFCTSGLNKKFYVSGGNDQAIASFFLNESGQSWTKYFGDINMNGYSIINQSDIRLKTNIASTSIKALDAITKFDFKKYNWIIDGRNEDIGLIAQQIKLIAPNLVTEEGGLLGINLQGLIMYALKGIQELKEQIDSNSSNLPSFKATPIKQLILRSNPQYGDYPLAEKQAIVDAQRREKNPQKIFPIPTKLN